MAKSLTYSDVKVSFEDGTEIDLAGMSSLEIEEVAPPPRPLQSVDLTLPNWIMDAFGTVFFIIDAEPPAPVRVGGRHTNLIVMDDLSGNEVANAPTFEDWYSKPIVIPPGTWSVGMDMRQAAPPLETIDLTGAEVEVNRSKVDPDALLMADGKPYELALGDRWVKQKKPR